MQMNDKYFKSFFFRHWWLYYLSAFLLLGWLIYLLTLNQDINNRVIALDKRFDECYNEKLQNDSLRVVNNAGQFGCLSFTLFWDTADDLDLIVIDAKQDSVYYKKHCKSYDNRFSRAGGQLDIDLNADRNIQSNPVENTFFKCIPPAGNYVVKVHAFEKRVNRPVPFKVVVRERGQVTKELSGVISNQDQLINLINYNYHGAQ